MSTIHRMRGFYVGSTAAAIIGCATVRGGGHDQYLSLLVACCLPFDFELRDGCPRGQSNLDSSLNLKWGSI